MDRTFDAEKLDVAALAERMGPGSTLTLNTIRKKDMKRLMGLEALPLEMLALRWFFGADLTAVPLPPTLKALRVWQSSKLVSLDGIEQALTLSDVALRGNARLEDATALRKLPALRSLSIEGDSTSLQKVASLAFIEGLPLRHLSLVAVDGAALDLGPVARLPALDRLDLYGYNFPPDVLAQVAAAHPWFEEQLMDLPDSASFVPRCKKCGGVQKELFLKGKKRDRCPVCDKGGIDKVLEEFRAMVENARRISA